MIRRSLVLAIILTLAGIGLLAIGSASNGRCESLKVWYDLYNLEYFSGSLPDNTMLDYNLEKKRTAAKTDLKNNFYDISFNPDYAIDPLYTHIVLLHEMCHVKTFGEDQDHGSKWRQCMADLYEQKAFEEILLQP